MQIPCNYADCTQVDRLNWKRTANDLCDREVLGRLFDTNIT